MYAIIETGGKQYKVQNGDLVKVEKLNAEAGSTVVFDKVLAAGEGSDIKVGTPYLDGLTVEGTVVESGKGDKVIIFKYKAKKDYRKKQGHRQPYTMVEITSVAGVKAEPKKEEPAEAPAEEAAEEKAEEVVEEAAEEVVEEVVEEAEEVAEEAADEKPIEKMLKAELIEYAEKNGVEIDPKATKAVIIEAIKAAK
ncbi:MAG: 50S ribosomal protein L21 [Bacillota bacterium]